MDFSVGQHIVHPAHGAGTIVGVQEQELVEGFQRYYVIRFADKRLTVRVPQRRTTELGLRRVMGTAKCEEVFGVLSSLPKQLPNNFKDRRRAVEKLIHSGKPLMVAEALRELSWRRETEAVEQSGFGVADTGERHAGGRDVTGDGRGKRQRGETDLRSAG